MYNMIPETSQPPSDGIIGSCHVGTDALIGIRRQPINPSRWNGHGWQEFAAALREYNFDARRVFGDEVADRHLAMKHAADPAMILNKDVIF